MPFKKILCHLIYLVYVYECLPSSVCVHLWHTLCLQSPEEGCIVVSHRVGALQERQALYH